MGNETGLRFYRNASAVAKTCASAGEQAPRATRHCGGSRRSIDRNPPWAPDRLARDGLSRQRQRREEQGLACQEREGPRANLLHFDG